MISLFGLASLALLASQSPVRGANKGALADGGSISFDPAAPPGTTPAGDKNYILVLPGTYTDNAGWTVSSVVVTAVPTVQSPDGGSVTAAYKRNKIWGGLPIDPDKPDVPSVMTLKNQGNTEFPAGTYNVQAKITFSKEGSADVFTFSDVKQVVITAR